MKTSIAFALLFVSSTWCICQPSGNPSELHNDFSLRVYKACITDSSNLIVSPYSLRIALMATAEGSAGQTRNRFDSLVIMGDAASTKNLLLNIGRKGETTGWLSNTSNAIETANAFWANRNYNIKQDYLDLLKKDFQTEYFSFNPQHLDEVDREIDQWVTDKTHGKITDMPAPNDLSVVIILNAVYFSNRWTVPFKPRKTKSRIFYSITGNRQKIPFMNADMTLGYYEDEDVQALSLPYENNFSMWVILPSKKYGLSSIESKIDSKLLHKIFASSHVHPVSIQLPKFKLQSEIDMLSQLAAHGFGGLFFADADFSKMSPDATFAIGGLIQKTFIDVDEKKTEAAAVTEVVVITGGVGGELPPPPAPKLFKADHPFLFLIVDSNTDSIVFAGRFVEGN